MSSVQQLVKTIRQLPYTDMMLVARDLADLLSRQKGALDAPLIAELLTKIHANVPEVADSRAQELKIIREMFGRRKRQITVTPIQPNSPQTGYSTIISELSGTQAMGTDLRVCLNQSIDQAVTMHALTRMK